MCFTNSIYIFSFFEGSLSLTDSFQNSLKTCINCIYNVQKLFSGGGRKRGREDVRMGGGKERHGCCGDRCPWLAFSALEVSFNDMHYINLHFTYLLIFEQVTWKWTFLNWQIRTFFTVTCLTVTQGVAKVPWTSKILLKFHNYNCSSKECYFII